jgi:hypothetical protein
VILVRKPVSALLCPSLDILISAIQKSFADDSMGTWIFEGYIHAGSGFVGRWYSSGAPDQDGLEGIFSMRKTHDPRQK